MSRDLFLSGEMLTPEVIQRYFEPVGSFETRVYEAPGNARQPTGKHFSMVEWYDLYERDGTIGVIGCREHLEGIVLEKYPEHSEPLERSHFVDLEDTYHLYGKPGTLLEPVTRCVGLRFDRRVMDNGSEIITALAVNDPEISTQRLRRLGIEDRVVVNHKGRGYDGHQYSEVSLLAHTKAGEVADATKFPETVHDKVFHRVPAALLEDSVWATAGVIAGNLLGELRYAKTMSRRTGTFTQALLAERRLALTEAAVTNYCDVLDSEPQALGQYLTNSLKRNHERQSSLIRGPLAKILGLGSRDEQVVQAAEDTIERRDTLVALARKQLRAAE